VLTDLHSDVAKSTVLYAIEKALKKLSARIRNRITELMSNCRDMKKEIISLCNDAVSSLCEVQSHDCSRLISAIESVRWSMLQTSDDDKVTSS